MKWNVRTDSDNKTESSLNKHERDMQGLICDRLTVFFLWRVNSEFICNVRNILQIQNLFTALGMPSENKCQ